MIKVAQAPDGTFSYVAKMPDGEIVLGGDSCDSIEEIQKFFADLVSCATDDPCTIEMVHVELVKDVEIPTSNEPLKATTTPEAVYPLGGTDMRPKKMSAPTPGKKRKAK